MCTLPDSVCIYVALHIRVVTYNLGIRIRVGRTRNSGIVQVLYRDVRCSITKFSLFFCVIYYT